MGQTSGKGPAPAEEWARKLAGTFGLNLGRALTRRNLSLSEAARRVGVTRQAVANWTQGQLPEWPSLAAICVALDISLAELFEGRYDERPVEERLAERLNEQLRVGEIHAALQAIREGLEDRLIPAVDTIRNRLGRGREDP